VIERSEHERWLRQTLAEVVDLLRNSAIDGGANSLAQIIACGVPEMRRATYTHRRGTVNGDYRSVRRLRSRN
jgi:hypothetical protein